MNLFAPLLFIPFVTGGIFALVGWFMFSFPPKEINSLYGYRTPSSMKSQERWDFAQTYAAKQMIKTGLIMMLISLSGLFVNIGEGGGAITGLIITIAAAGGLIASVERAIKKQFGKE